jgi:phospholipase D1/2
MKFQYDSISRGGYSILESIEKAGVPDASTYIRFYNLRNFDRINANAVMTKAEKESGVSYETARREHDDIVGAGYGEKGEGTDAAPGQSNDKYDLYQASTSKMAHAGTDSYDTVSSAYMDSGVPLTSIPWNGNPSAEIDAYVSEELYIHTKILIADDRTAIIGSANMNDRSQLGYRDSEIAVIIQDPTPIPSMLNGAPFQASKFATSLRRQLFRKHLGLLPFQHWEKPDGNFLPTDTNPSNIYDWGSAADVLVCDPMSHEFSNLWNGTAKANTEVYAKAFHPVPADNVRNWSQYLDFFGKYFINPDPKTGKYKMPDGDHDAEIGKDGKVPEAKYKYGHVVREEFPGGVSELKELLSSVRGTLVEMPLKFMDGVNFAEEGVELNFLTEEIYT